MEVEMEVEVCTLSNTFSVLHASCHNFSSVSFASSTSYTGHDDTPVALKSRQSFLGLYPCLMLPKCSERDQKKIPSKLSKIHPMKIKGHVLEPYRFLL